MSAPAVSVVMAAYNGAALIGETLASLARQRFADFEVLVVDDCSTDATREVVARFPDPRIRLIALEANGGPVRARNRAVAEARGRYVAALDQDDLCHPDRFARQVAWLDAHPGVALLATAADVLTPAGEVIRGPHARVTTPALVGWLLRIGNPLVWSSVMVRGEVARALDPFTRPDLLYAEDFDLYHRVARYGAVSRLDAPLLTYRRHAGGASQRYEDIMLASARRVLAGAHAPAMGEVAAEEAAALFVRHFMHGLPVAGGAELARLAAALAAARRAYVEEAEPSPRDRRLIDRATRHRWAQAVRTALREGTIGTADALAAAPPVGQAPRLDQLAWAGFVGRLRAVRRRHTLAA